MRNILLATALIPIFIGCDNRPPTSDEKQQNQQEVLLQEATSEVGMPAIKNFRERKLLRDIYEMRDQSGLVTYTYLENLQPAIVHGRTALGGKLTYVGESIGYGIPYATQFTSPEKAEFKGNGMSVSAWITLPQADPNGLFSPASAEGTWVLLKNPNGNDVKPVYIEPRIIVSPFKLPAD